MVGLKALVKFSKVSLGDIKEIYTEVQENKKSAIRSDGEMLLACLDSDLEQIKADVGDEAIIFYVSGYTAFKEMKRSNCDSCVSLLAKEKEAPVICFDLEEPKISGQEVDSASNEANSLAEDEKKNFLDKINRGGLCTPSDLVYITCLHA